MHEIKKRVKQNGEISFTASIRKKGFKTITKTFKKESLAKQFIRDTETDMDRGKFVDYVNNEHTLSELIKRYETFELPKRKSDIAKFKMHLEWWNKEIGKYFLYKITASILTECKQKLENEPTAKLKLAKSQKVKEKLSKIKRSPATVNRYLATLSVVLSYACNEYGWISDNPMRKVRKNKEKANKDRFLNADEIDRLLNACKEYDTKRNDLVSYNKELYIFVLIALNTGARYSEILNLTWANIDFENRQFYFLNTKNGENRGVYITDNVYNVLMEYKKSKKIRSIKSNDYLFLNSTGEKFIDMHTRFDAVKKKANLNDVRFHDLRHTVASHIAMNGGSLLDIAQVTGHKTMQMVKRYSHLTQKHTAELLENTTSKMFEKVNNK